VIGIFQFEQKITESRLLFRVFISIFTIAVFGCNNAPKEKSNSNVTSPKDTSTIDDFAILKQKEQASSEKLPGNLGELIRTISFSVRTDDKTNFADGLVPWASIEKPEVDIPNLVDGNVIVIPEHEVTVVIDYPLKNEYRFNLLSKTGFTKVQLLNEISKGYYKLYHEEEETATIKTIPVGERTKMYNRNQTDGKYGVWGHDIADLVLSEISVFKNANGKLILALNIQS